MKIIDRYMIKGFISPLIWCLFTFTVMAVIIDIFSFIDDIVRFKIPASAIFAFELYNMPTVFVQIAPMAVLLSSIFVLSALNKNNEIVAMKSSGISLWRMLTPLLAIGMIMSICIFIVNDRVIPPTSKMANMIRRDELEKQKNKNSQTKIIPNIAIYGSGNRIIFARSYDTEKMTLEDIIIHEQDETASLTSKITAKSGAWTGYGWKFYKVDMWKIDNAGRILGKPAFYKEKMIVLKEKPRDFATKEWKSEFLTYKELKRYIRNFKGVSTKITKGLLVDLHYKISFSLISLIIILIGSPFALITTRGGVLIGVGMSIAIGLLYYAFIAISLAFGKAGYLAPFVSAWLGNFVFAVLGIYLINKRT